MRVYKKRIVDGMLHDWLDAKGAVVIEGAKWCGKTTTAMQVAKSTLRMDDPAKRDEYVRMAEISPARLLQGEVPRLIDEWQLAPRIWDAVRFEIDSRDEEGQFILTGSAVPVESREITHSGTGRFTWLKMRTMSLYESEESSGEVSLQALFSTPRQVEGRNVLDIDRLAYVICRGGWPRAISMRKKNALEQAFDYYDAVVRSDINRADGVRKNPERVKRLMASYARHQGTQVSHTMFRNDVAANDVQSISEDTIAAYINALKKIYVVEDMPAWNPNLRSRTAIRTSDTRYYADPSIAAASLGIGPEDLLNDLETMGLFFETLCVRDLRVYAESLGGEVYHYRDKTGLECDTVIHLRNGKYGLAEIKLGGEKFIGEGARNLKKLAASIDTSKMHEPSFCMVVVGIGDFAYRREDGVYVVPIGCLKN